MEAKHTPGPWRVEIRNTVLAICCKTTRRGEWPEITFIERDGHPEHGSITGRMRTGEELMANAQLIAAAPELLEACKALSALVEKHADEHYDDTSYALWSSPARVKAHAAIAHAEGRNGAR